MSSVTSTLRPILWTVFPTTAFGVSVSTFWCGPHASALSLYSSVPLLNCWRRTVLMLERDSLFTIRSDWEFVSLKSPSSPSLLISFPSLARLSTFISFLVNWNWILHSTWWLCLCSYINFDSCDHPLLCVQIYYGTETTVDSFRFRVCCLRSDGSSHILLCSSSRKELDKSLNPYL